MIECDWCEKREGIIREDLNRLDGSLGRLCDFCYEAQESDGVMFVYRTPDLEKMTEAQKIKYERAKELCSFDIEI